MGWIRTENSEAKKPETVIRSGNRVVINKNFKKIQATAETPEHWEYDTWDMTAEQYEVYQDMETRTKEQEDALIELAGILAELEV